MTDLASIFENALIFRSIYDIIRVVDPVRKRAFKYRGGRIDMDMETCFAFWKNSGFCENCISLIAYNENRSVVKLEYTGQTLFLIISAAIEVSGEKYVLEMLKDVTDSLIVENLQSMTDLDSQKLLESMNEIMIKDELTGIYNRKFINQRLPADIFSSISAKKPFSIIMADIDNFKRVNDTYGHLAGDFILAKFAKLLSSSVRGNTDWVARYGGEEFIIALYNADSKIAYEVSEKLRKLVENEIFDFEGNQIKITASFGISTLSLDAPDMDMKKMISIADRNLYTAKQTGRNKSIQ